MVETLIKFDDGRKLGRIAKFKERYFKINLIGLRNGP